MLSPEPNFRDDIWPLLGCDSSHKSGDTITLCHHCGEAFPPSSTEKSRSPENSQILRSGRGLEGSRAMHATEIIAQNVERTVQLENEMIHLGRLIRKLAAEKNEVNEEIRWQKALLAPIRRLPPDIVRTIMEIVWEADAEDSEDNIYYRDDDRDFLDCNSKRLDRALLLSQICAYWREVAIGHRKLWSHIFVPRPVLRRPNDGLKFNYEAMKDMEDKWLLSGEMFEDTKCRPPNPWVTLALERSGAYPLTVHTDPSHREPYGPLYELVQQTSRWRHLSISGGMLHHIPKNVNLSILRSLSLLDRSVLDPPVQWPSALTDAPMLCEVKAHLSLHVMKLPWMQLTSLSLIEYNDPLELLLSVLSQCINLKALELCLEEDRLPSSGLAPVTLDSVSSFRFRFPSLMCRDDDDPAEYECHFHFCLLFTFPSLTFLSLAGCSEPRYGSYLENVLGLIRRSQCKLTTFELFSVKFADPAIGIELLDAMPELTKLRLIQRRDQADPNSAILLKRLGSAHDSLTGQKLFLPKLRHLILWSTFEFDLTGKLIEELLDFRTAEDRHIMAPLESFLLGIAQTYDYDPDSDSGEPSEADIYRPVKRRQHLSAKLLREKLQRFTGRNTAIVVRG